MRAIIICVLTFLAAACSQQDMAEMQTEKLSEMGLDAREIAIAEAVIEGFKKETGMPVLRSRDVMRAGCYAKSVDMPSQHHRVHKLYLADYTEIDKNFYPWFNAQGVDDNTAYDIAQRVSKGFDECAVGKLLKKRFSKE